jgi:hypothetical protein
MSCEKNTDNNTCSICWEELNENTTITLCKHIFHKKCIEEWKEYQKNCPYCRASFIDRVPTILFDELIANDGNIEQLTVDNFKYYYYLNESNFNQYQILQYINRIKYAKQIKSNLLLYKNYKISGEGVGNYRSSIGTLTKITQISFDGYFSCHFHTVKGLEIYHSNLHSFELV